MPTSPKLPTSSKLHHPSSPIELDESNDVPEIEVSNHQVTEIQNTDILLSTATNDSIEMTEADHEEESKSKLPWMEQRKLVS
eukprot:CAMPEP_0204636686 /NCGR_PEP_ID=MMETSP0717-20131115/34602_1 /ASSEMBLY_ACC=CAM_ASM_000666 /TAXON_ID=230516 /ORGANISM="Chaetoceros curvisetus" /LENGTH=81 /DNA_ID=CAMNT_0051655815 /DNA_START=132 /DNA_END=377 /DNA_ORIENTATION=+